MKIKKFNENWIENAFSRKNEYGKLLNDVFDVINKKFSEWIEDKLYHYTPEMYDILNSIISNIEVFDENLYNLYKEKLEEINKKQ